MKDGKVIRTLLTIIKGEIRYNRGNLPLPNKMLFNQENMICKYHLS